MDNSNPASGNSAPLGTIQGGAAGSQSGGGSANPNAASAPISLTEDSMVVLPGAKDPVRYGDHYRGFQSEFTKRAQEAKRYRAESETYKGQIEELKRAQAQYAANNQQGGQQQRPNPSGELASALKSLAYLTGEDAARVVEHLSGQFTQMESQLQKRDQAIGLMYNQLKKYGDTLGTLEKGRAGNEFESKISRFMTSVGVPTELSDWVKETYLAYEGEDLDQEFPNILKKRFDQLQGHFTGAQRKRVEEARRAPFVPGRGGNGSPSKQLQNFSKASARDIADAMWPGAVNGEVDT